MPLLQGTDRHQMQIFAVEQLIQDDNPVRVIDAVVDHLQLDELGFVVKGKSH